MPILPKKSVARPWIPIGEKKPYVSHKARTADYDTPEWKALRKELLREHPICCIAGCEKPTKVADHVVPVRLGGAFYDLRNLQGLCWSHHQSKSARERHHVPDAT